MSYNSAAQIIFFPWKWRNILRTSWIQSPWWLPCPGHSPPEQMPSAKWALQFPRSNWKWTGIPPVKSKHYSRFFLHASKKDQSHSPWRNMKLPDPSGCPRPFSALTNDFSRNLSNYIHTVMHFSLDLSAPTDGRICQICFYKNQNKKHCDILEVRELERITRTRQPGPSILNHIRSKCRVSCSTK